MPRPEVFDFQKVVRDMNVGVVEAAKRVLANPTAYTPLTVTQAERVYQRLGPDSKKM